MIEGSRSGLACVIAAISPSDRVRYQQLVRRAVAAIRDSRELENGFVFRIDSQSVSLPEIAEWLGMERLCCPFLDMQLAVSSGESDWTITLTGPPGVKEILEAAFEAHVDQAL
jgi:hypothetical protein